MSIDHAPLLSRVFWSIKGKHCRNCRILVLGSDVRIIPTVISFFWWRDPPEHWSMVEEGGHGNPRVFVDSEINFCQNVNKIQNIKLEANKNCVQKHYQTADGYLSSNRFPPRFKQGHDDATSSPSAWRQDCPATTLFSRPFTGKIRVFSQLNDC